MNSPAAIAAVAALADGVRRELYTYVRRSGRPVTREEAAAATGISRKLAAFHLDKLVEAGLLRVGLDPGPRRVVGRRPKSYLPAAADVRVTLPERRDDLLARILVDAVLREAPGERASDAAVRAAAEHGRERGAAERRRLRPGRLGVERALTSAGAALDRCGYETYRETPSRVRLRNCPFHALALAAPELVCAVNHAMLAGVLDGMGAARLEAVLSPRAGECCVELRPAPTGDGRP